MSENTILTKFEQDMSTLLSDFGYRSLSCHSKLIEPFGMCFTFKLENNQETDFYFDPKNNNVIISDLIVNGVIQKFKHNNGKSDDYVNSLVDILKYYLVEHTVTDSMSVSDIIIDIEEESDIPFVFNILLSANGDFNAFVNRAHFLDIEHEFDFHYSFDKGLNIDSVLSLIYWSDNNRVNKLQTDKLLMADSVSTSAHLQSLKLKAKLVVASKLSKFNEMTLSSIMDLDDSSFNNMLDVFKMDLI